METNTVRAKRPLCGANLGSKGQNTRLRLGLFMMTLGLVLAVFLVRSDAARYWRMLLFFPFLMAALGALQGLYRTCPGHTMQAIAEDESGETHKVFNPAERRASRKNAFKVMTMSVVTAVCATAFVLVVP